MTSDSNIKKLFGANLKKLRVRNNLTQEKLAELVELDYKTISFIETGRTFISGDTYSKLCNYFNVEPEYFFKTKHVQLTKKGEDLKLEINRLLSDCDEDTLNSIYNVIAALKK